MHVIFLHGLESGPHGSKYQALVTAGFQVTAPDFRGKNLAERVKETAQLLQDNPEVIVVGSSYGGITAVIAAMKSVTPKAMVLCAPALERDEEPNTDPSKLKALCPTIIIHGTNDDVIPLGVSIRFAQRNPSVSLIQVNDDHRLGAEASEVNIVNAVRELV